MENIMNGYSQASPTSNIDEISYLSFFRIYKTYESDQKAQIKVFANGRQKCQIKVGMVFNDRQGNVLTFDSSQLAEILRLRDYTDDQDLQIWDGGESAVAGWGYSHKLVNPVFDWDESFINDVDSLRCDLYAESHGLPRSNHAWNMSFFKGMMDDAETNNLTEKQFASGISTASTDLNAAADSKEGLRPPPINASVVTLYLATSEMSTKEIAAAIFIKGKLLTHTAHRDAKDDDGYGGNQSLFHSSVIVHGRPPYRPEPSPPAFGKIDNGGLLIQEPIRSSVTLHLYQSRINLFFNGMPIRLIKASFVRDLSRQAWRHGALRDGLYWSAYFVADVAESTYQIDEGPLDKMAESNGSNAQTIEQLFNAVGGKNVIGPSNYEVVIGQLAGTKNLYPKDRSDRDLGIKLTHPFDILDAWGTMHPIELYIPDQSRIAIRRAYPAPPTAVANDARSKASETMPERDLPILAIPFRHIQDPLITIEQSQVYSNGLAQAAVRISMQVMDGATRSTLTPRERSTIRLIRYTDGVAIPIDAPPVTGWTSSLEHRGYAPYPGSTGEPVAKSPHADVQIIYLSATDAARAQDLVIGFEVTLEKFDKNGPTDEVITYQTNGYWYKNGVRSTYELSLDTRDRNIVRAMAPVMYSANEIQISPDSRPPRPVYDEPLTVSISHLGVIVPIRSMECSPASLIHWIRPKDSSYTNPCFIGFARPDEEDVSYDKTLEDALEKLDKNHLGPKKTDKVKDRGVLMLCARVGIVHTDIPNPPKAPMIVPFIDGFGTSHKFNLEFTPGKRDELMFR